MERYNKRKIGSIKEHLAAEYLKKIGYEIIEMNFFSRNGEIDIIARDADYLVFVEVKYRKDKKLGTAVEAVNYQKQLSIIRTAQYYLYKKGYAESTKCRFDVIAIQGTEVSLIKNAFEL